jgi:hypothetical protein
MKPPASAGNRRNAVPIPPLKSWQIIPVPPPTLPSWTGSGMPPVAPSASRAASTEVLDAVEEQAYYADRVDRDQQVTADNLHLGATPAERVSADDHSFFVSPPSGDSETVLELPFIAPNSSLDVDSIGQAQLARVLRDDSWGAVTP